MAEDFVQVAPDHTGARLRTRSRVIGANTVEEPYVIALPSEAVPINRGWLSTNRIPTTVSLAAASNINLFTIWNGIASGGNMVNIRRLSIEIDTTAVMTGASPVLRLFRMSTAASGGTVLTPVQQYTAEPVINSLVSIRSAQNATTDGGAIATITPGTLDANTMWSQTCPKIATAAGIQHLGEYHLMPNDPALTAIDPLILMPQQGLCVRFTNPVAMPATGIYTFMIKAVLAEFTYP